MIKLHALALVYIYAFICHSGLLAAFETFFLPFCLFLVNIGIVDLRGVPLVIRNFHFVEVIFHTILFRHHAKKVARFLFWCILGQKLVEALIVLVKQLSDSPILSFDRLYFIFQKLDVILAVSERDQVVVDDVLNVFRIFYEVFVELFANLHLFHEFVAHRVYGLFPS